MNDPFARLGFAMARWRWFVIAIWLVITVVSGALFAPRTAGVLQGGGFILPNSESDDAEIILRDEFNASTASNLLAVFTTDDDKTIDDPDIAAEITAGLDRVAENEGVLQVLSVYNAQDPTLVSEDRRTTVAIISMAGIERERIERVEEIRHALEDVSIRHNVTGTAAINEDVQAVSERDLRKAEMFTIPIVLVLLLLVFRSIIAAAIPLMMGACSVVVTLALLYGIANQTDVSIFALNVASMIGLGLGIDFSLICVSRYREELASGRSVPTAVAMTMATSGRSITYSAIT
ncbi:MAG: MMPL family transporter, partial [Vicinamibacterales bacterium]